MPFDVQTPHSVASPRAPTASGLERRSKNLPRLPQRICQQLQAAGARRAEAHRRKKGRMSSLSETIRVKATVKGAHAGWLVDE